MAGYRRFVAYVYEYRKGKKEQNCGFIRAEEREGQCRIEAHIKCLGLQPECVCTVYGILRREKGFTGVKMSECMTVQDGMDTLFYVKENDIDGSGTAFEKIGGIVLATKEGAFFGTEWDDIPIRPEEMLLKEEGRSEESREGHSEEEEEGQSAQVRKLAAEGMSSPEAASSEEKISSAEGMPSAEKISSAVKISSADKLSSSEKDPSAEKISSEDNKHSEERKASEEKKASGEKKASEERKASQEICHTGAEEKGEKEKIKLRKQESREASAVGKSENTSSPELKIQETSSEKSLKPREGNIPPGPSVFLPGEAFEPFRDGEIIECRKIQLSDLRYFGRCEQRLASNRFVIHGYYAFGHLIYGKTPEGQTILGVPGSYDQQECFMAGMLGFPFFKESPEIQLPRRRGGYWYRSFYTPDFHNGNSLR